MLDYVSTIQVVIIRSLIEITELQKAVHTYGIPVVHYWDPICVHSLLQFCYLYEWQDDDHLNGRNM